jgi:hypothetical protein
MIPIERFPFLHAWLVAANSITETSHDESKEKEASKTGSDIACDEIERWRY